MVNVYQNRAPWMAKCMPETTITVTKCHDVGIVYTTYFHAPSGSVRTVETWRK